jgi:hypothetical protein
MRQMTRSLTRRSVFATAERMPDVEVLTLRFRSGACFLAAEGVCARTADEGMFDSGLVMSVSPSLQQQK